MLKLAVVGLGRMGLSHLAIINSHPRVQVQAVCDSAGYLLDVFGKYTGARTYADFDEMTREVELDAVLIATPSSLHARVVKAALERNLHVFCEKPFCLDTREGRELGRLAAEKGVVNQVGYHNRFVGAFQEVKRLLDLKAIGKVTHALAEAYGPVVLQPKGSTWRTRRTEGGGCMFDYAAHPINLMNWYFGAPHGVGGSVLGQVFSQDTDDQVLSTMYFPDGKAAQLSVNWSDDSCRKMSTKVTIWGTGGKIYADRQECQVYLRATEDIPPGYKQGWNVRYTTELTEPVWFYLRGEEYSAQLDHFVRCIEGSDAAANLSSFQDALITDTVIEMMIADAAKGPSLTTTDTAPQAAKGKRRFLQFFFDGVRKSPRLDAS